MGGLAGGIAQGAGGILGGTVNPLMDALMGGGVDHSRIVDAATKQQADQQYGNVQQGLEQQMAFLQALQAQGGVQNQSDVYKQLAGVASGEGPNPAQAMLNQATGQNVANQAALMAGQRGASANPALIARQAAQQGANLQQQAVGQGASMQAQQSLNALSGMGNIAGQQVQNQGNAAAGYSQAAQGAQNNILNAINAQNNAHAGLSLENSRQRAQMMGNIMGAAGSAAGGMAHGGQVQPPQYMADGGQVSGPKSFVGRHLSGSPMPMADGGMVPVKLSPGEIYVDPSKAKEVAKGKEKASEAGKRVPGKAKVEGDSLKNDTYSTELKAGGVVIPRTKARDDKKSADFVRAVLSRSSRKK